MPLSNISEKPDEAAHGAYDFSHYQDHLEIAQAIKTQYGKALQASAIYPALERDEAWRRLHQTLHTDMHAVLGTNGQDLTGEMDPTWYFNNYQEHLAVRTKLGI